MARDQTNAPPRLLMVCLGNICRSPTAEAAVKEAAAEAGIPVAVSSAGTGSWHIGNPPDRRMQAAAAAVGLTVDGVAQQVDDILLHEADVVFAMDTSNLRDLQDLVRRHGMDTPLHLFRAFDPLADSQPDVPDPYYGGQAGFDEVVEICRRTAREIVRRLPDLVTPTSHHANSN